MAIPAGLPNSVAQSGLLHNDPALIMLAIALIVTVVALPIIAKWARPGGLSRLVERIHTFLGGDRSISFEDTPARGITLELVKVLEEWRLLSVDQLRKLEGERSAQREILDSLREGVLAINRSKRIVLVNARVGDLFGFREDVMGKALVQVLRHSSVLAAFDRALEGRHVSASITVQLPSEQRQIELNVIPFKSSSDIVAMALFFDITRLMRLERIRRDFMADFSHEVRTPLAGLRTAIETLETSRVTRVQEEKLRKVIARQLRRLERLVEDLSELDQIESGELVLQREPTELLRLLRDLHEDFSDRTEQRRITLHIEGDESIANVDPSKIQQIFSNLVENAIKFSRVSGTVRLIVENTPEESVVRVVDEGEGIPPEEQERIFNRFYRIDRSRSQEVPGAGLGLAITKHLVIRHGGTIRVFSTPGKGSTFEVRLPKGDVRSYPRLAGQAN